MFAMRIDHDGRVMLARTPGSPYGKWVAAVAWYSADAVERAEMRRNREEIARG